MQIPTYQIHNVLNVYCRKLHSETIANATEKSANQSMRANVHALAHGKRQSMIDKIEADIVDRITHGIIRPNEKGASGPSKFEVNSERENGAINDHFVFNMIDENNVKTTRQLYWCYTDFLTGSAMNSQQHHFQPSGSWIEREKPTPTLNGTGRRENAVPPPPGNSKHIPAAGPTVDFIRSLAIDGLERSGEIEKIKQIYLAGRYTIDAEQITRKMIDFHSEVIM